MTTQATTYKRQNTAMERLFTRSPFSVVTMVARIEGEVTEEALTVAVDKVQQRHINLRVRFEDDDQHNPWFTTERVAAIPIEVIPRESADQWIQVARETGKIPFDVEKRPAIRCESSRAVQGHLASGVDHRQIGRSDTQDRRSGCGFCWAPHFPTLGLQPRTADPNARHVARVHRSAQQARSAPTGTPEGPYVMSLPVSGRICREDGGSGAEGVRT